MTEAHARLLSELEQLELQIRALAETLTAVERDLETITRQSFQDGGRAAVEELQTALSVQSLYGAVRGRFRALGHEALLIRTNDATVDDWASICARRLRRIFER